MLHVCSPKNRHYVPLEHRTYIWRCARAENRWPDRAEWRFILLGRWPGF